MILHGRGATHDTFGPLPSWLQRKYLAGFLLLRILVGAQHLITMDLIIGVCPHACVALT